MDTVKERIEKEAKKRVDAEYEIDYPVEEYYIKGFVHGAIAERNKTIDECITLLGEDALIVRNKSVLIEQLEKLKL